MEVSVDARRLEKMLRTIVGERDPLSSQDHLSSVEMFIENELAGYGLQMESDYFPYRGGNFRT